MKAVVIGAGGYIARNLIHINQTENFADVAAYGHSPEHIDGIMNYQPIDLRRKEEVETAISDCDLIYFFTGKTGTLQSFERPEEYTELNENALLRLLNAYRAVGSRAKIVFPSTRLVYRGSGKPLAESAAKQMLTPYAMQKYACEQYLEMYHRLFGVRYCVLRICVPYGSLVYPVSSYGVVDAFFRQARETGRIRIYGNGMQKRTFTFMGDLCHILWRSGLSEACENNVYNVGGQGLTLRELAERVAETVGAAVLESPWPEDARKIESGSTAFDAGKLEGILHYKYTMTVERWMKDMQENGKKFQTGGG